MNITLTKQEALELSQFLSDRANPMDRYPNVTAARAAVRIRHQIEECIKNYSEVFANLVKEDQDALKAAQEKIKTWEEDLKKQDKAPSPQAKDEFAQPLQTEFNKLREKLQGAAVTHEQDHGQTKITIELKGKYPKKDWNVVKDFFETNGQKFPMWSLGDKLTQMAEVFEQN